jgi:hypothetical protein
MIRYGIGLAVAMTSALALIALWLWRMKRQLDRGFYDSLGDERADVSCRSPECGRGAVKLSVFCKVHHFEQIMKSRCPFRH